MSLGLYQRLISEATGYTEAAELEAIEDCMRHDVLHSTLDWLTADQFKSAAQEAASILRQEKVI